MTIAEVAVAIAERRALGQKVFAVKVNPTDLMDMVRELPTATAPGTNACLAVTDGVRSFLISGARILPRAAVTAGTMIVVSIASDVET